MALIVAGMWTSAGASELLIERVELCALQAQVDSLIVRIERQHAAIDVQKKTMVSRVERFPGAGWSQRLSAYLVYLAQWSIGQADIARRHLSIGSLETSLLVAYSRLGAAKDARQGGITPEQCSMDGQLPDESPPFEIVASER
ncbi:MAG: hypothetical protein HKN42_13295 [Granulosicoccus sp.]|nr:hypothetical protein [Granulosicoccus sp.]